MEWHRELNDLKQTEIPWMYDVSKAAPQEALRSELKRLKRLHRRLSRKQKGSNNRAKARMLLARKHARLAHMRRDALHKGTSLLTRAALSPKVKQKQINQLLRQATEASAPMRRLMVLVEDLNVDGMKRNRKLALAISDVGMGEFKEDMDLCERIYVCENPACGLVSDRDVNAALNLAALAKSASQAGPYREFLGKGETPVERGALADLSQDG
jgi:transposase